MTGKYMEMLWLCGSLVYLLIGIVAVLFTDDVHPIAAGICCVILSVYCDMNARWQHEDHKED